MANKHQDEQVINQLNDIVDNFNHYFERHKNIILGVVGGIILVVGGFFVYKKFIKEPNELKAKDAIYMAQYLFANDSFNLALNGNATVKGFESIVKSYGSTAAGNTARFYAGVCCLNLGRFNDAIKYFDDFDTDDELLEARKYGCLGDAYAETKQVDKAIKSYIQAGKYTNELTAPTYLYRAALLSELNGKKKEALELFEQVNKEYPASQEGQAAELEIGKLEQEAN